MEPWRVLAGVVAAELSFGSAAQPQLVEVPLPTRAALVRQLTAPPGDFVELCTTLKARRPLRWQFEAVAPLAFNTHVHADGGVMFPESMSAVSAARGHLVLNGDHAYCWLWTNPNGMPVTIRVQLWP